VLGPKLFIVPIEITSAYENPTQFTRIAIAVNMGAYLIRKERPKENEKLQLIVFIKTGTNCQIK